MAMTPYSGNAHIIGALGTNPEERGLTTQEFKDKFDEGLTAFVAWFNSTHKTEFEAKVSKYGDTIAGNLVVLGAITIKDGTDNNKQITIWYNGATDEYMINVAQQGVSYKPLLLTCSNLIFSINGTTKVNMFGLGTALPATTGTMTATMDSSLKTITPTGNCTFNASGGAVGQECTFLITAGPVSYTMTFGTGFKSIGTLGTGTVSGKVFTFNFIFDGTNWVETGRGSVV